MRMESIEQSLITHQTKGMPGGMKPIPLAEIGQQGWNLLAEDLNLPLLVMKDSALVHNGQWMRKFLEISGAVLSPHGKTSMAPQLFKRQIADGSWAITCATVGHLQVYRDAGVPRVLMANQLVGKQAIRYVMEELRRDPDFDFYCLVDSVRGVELLAEGAKAHPAGRPLQVFLEMGVQGQRNGCRDLEGALAVARAVKAAAPHLSLRGVEGFEGVIHEKTPAAQVEAVTAFLDRIGEAGLACNAEALFGEGEVVLTAGGSNYYDLVIERFRRVELGRPKRIVTRSGCYLTQDHGGYAKAYADLLQRSPEARGLGEGLLPALELWAYVQSRPEPTRLLCGFGKRDVGMDSGYPMPVGWFRPGVHSAPQALNAGAGPADSVVVEMNDQHGFLDVPTDSPLQAGDLLKLGIKHPCTTFDKWRVVPIVDDEYTVRDAVRTFF